MRVLPTPRQDSGLDLLGSLGPTKGVILVCDCWGAYQSLARALPESHRAAVLGPLETPPG